MAYVYINHDDRRPDVKIGSHEGPNPESRRLEYAKSRGVFHGKQVKFKVPDGMAERIERRAHALLSEKRVSNNTEFGLNNSKASDFPRETGSFVGAEVQGFIGFNLKPCNFGLPDETPPASARTG